MNPQEMAAWAFILFSVIGAFWIYEQWVQKRFDGVWKRVDEKYADCVNNKIYDSDKEHAKEMADEKHDRVLEVIDNRLKPLEEAIKRIENYIREKLK